MPSKPTRLSLLTMLALLPVSGSLLAASDLATLFTTPQERQLINANRYKSDEVKPQVVIEKVDESPVQILAQEEKTVDYRISGISLATDGAHMAWINGVAYEDGARLEDGSQVKVISGDEVRVRITAPDGKHYFATSGETLTITYMAAVRN